MASNDAECDLRTGGDILREKVLGNFKAYFGKSEETKQQVPPGARFLHEVRCRVAT